MKMLNPYLIVTFIVFTTVGADYFLKVSSGMTQSFVSPQFWIGASLYSVTAAGWMLAMKHLSLATIGVYYSILTILFLTILGVFVFKESVTLREFIGIALAIASISLMTKFN
jgi:small multidrug resistance pump